MHVLFVFRFLICSASLLENVEEEEGVVHVMHQDLASQLGYDKAQKVEGRDPHAAQMIGTEEKEMTSEAGYAEKVDKANANESKVGGYETDNANNVVHEDEQMEIQKSESVDHTASANEDEEKEQGTAQLEEQTTNEDVDTSDNADNVPESDPADELDDHAEEGHKAWTPSSFQIVFVIAALAAGCACYLKKRKRRQSFERLAALESGKHAE